MRTKFFTGVGDAGKSKIGKLEISKADFLFEVLGSLDELNSWLGFCRVEAGKQVYKKISKNLNIASILKEIQEIIFIVQAEIAAIGFNFPASKKISPQKTAFLENTIKKIDRELPPLKKFVVPGGSEISARLDVARATARKTEKIIIEFSKKKNLSPELLKFLNRLSSCLFALARYVNFKLGIKEKNPSY